MPYPRTEEVASFIRSIQQVAALDFSQCDAKDFAPKVFRITESIAVLNKTTNLHENMQERVKGGTFSSLSGPIAQLQELRDQHDKLDQQKNAENNKFCSALFDAYQQYNNLCESEEKQVLQEIVQNNEAFTIDIALKIKACLAFLNNIPRKRYSNDAVSEFNKVVAFFEQLYATINENHNKVLAKQFQSTSDFFNEPMLSQIDFARPAKTFYEETARAYLAGEISLKEVTDNACKLDGLTYDHQLGDEKPRKIQELTETFKRSLSVKRLKNAIEICKNKPNWKVFLENFDNLVRLDDPALPSDRLDKITACLKNDSDDESILRANLLQANLNLIWLDLDCVITKITDQDFRGILSDWLSAFERSCSQQKSEHLVLSDICQIVDALKNVINCPSVENKKRWDSTITPCSPNEKTFFSTLCPSLRAIISSEEKVWRSINERLNTELKLRVQHDIGGIGDAKSTPMPPTKEELGALKKQKVETLRNKVLYCRFHSTTRGVTVAERAAISAWFDNLSRNYVEGALTDDKFNALSTLVENVTEERAITIAEMNECLSPSLSIEENIAQPEEQEQVVQEQKMLPDGAQSELSDLEKLQTALRELKQIASTCERNCSEGSFRSLLSQSANEVGNMLQDAYDNNKIPDKDLPTITKFVTATTNCVKKPENEGYLTAYEEARYNMRNTSIGEMPWEKTKIATLALGVFSILSGIILMTVAAGLSVSSMGVLSPLTLAGILVGGGLVVSGVAMVAGAVYNKLNNHRNTLFTSKIEVLDKGVDGAKEQLGVAQSRHQ